jgi:hypothetical protein
MNVPETDNAPLQGANPRTYTLTTMSKKVELQILHNKLYVDGQPMNGALTWLWDELVNNQEPFDLETTGSIGAGRRYREAQAVKAFRLTQQAGFNKAKR